MVKNSFQLQALFGALLMFFFSCSEDPCKDLECGNGDCVDGECVCNPGYEGDACSTEWSAKFLGSYSGFDHVTASTTLPSNVGIYNLNKPAVVTRHSATRISISNFGGFDSFMDSDIDIAQAGDSTANKMVIRFTDPSARRFAGEAIYNAGTIKGSYRVTYKDNTYDEVSFEYTKK